MAGRKPREIKKAQYYVWYLGWRECRGVWGREFTEPIARDLIQTRRQEELPKLTLEVSRKELKIVQLVEKKKGKTEKIKYPPIPAKDVTYAVQVLSPDEDVVACIYLGYNPQTRCAVHVHVYRCDSAETAAILMAHLNQLIELPEHQQRVLKIEAELVAKGQVIPRPQQFLQIGTGTSDGHSTTRTSSSEGDHSDHDIRDVYQRSPRSPKSPRAQDIEEDAPTKQDLNLYDSLAAELRAKLSSKDNQPILLPPKDYDTIHRAKGKVLNIEERKATSEKVVGQIGATGVMQPAKNSSGEDSARGDSDNSSIRNSYNGEMAGSQIAQAINQMPWPQINIEEDYDETSSGQGLTSNRSGSRHSHHSNGIPEDPYAVQGEERNPVFGRNNLSPRVLSPSQEGTPRGDLSPRADLSPRLARHARSASPLPRSRELSPIRYNPGSSSGRPMSPPPELRNSYFPKSSLPNYLTSESDIYSRDRHMLTRGASQHGPKYSASSLGLTDRGPLLRNPAPRDEGYRSMDRHDNLRPMSGHGYFDNPYGSMDRHNNPGDVDLTTSMPAMNLHQYRGRDDNVRGGRYNELPPPDYSMRGIPNSAGSGFDFLP